MSKGGEQNMQTTYVNGSNTATNGTALSTAAERDVVVHKLIIGAPVASGNIWLYTITNPVNAATTNIAFKWSLPATLPTTGAALVNVIDFGGEGYGGLLLNEGGNIIIDQTMQVTVIWSYLDDIKTP